MNGSWWDRTAAAGGAVFAVLYGAGFVLQGLALGGEEESRAEIVSRYSDGGNELSALLGGLLVGVGVAFLLLFLGSLRATLRRVEDEQPTFSAAALAGGVLMAALFAASSATTMAAFSTYDVEAYEVDPDPILLLRSLAFYAQGFALVGGGVLAGATSVVALRTRILPRWLAIVGLVLAGVFLLGPFALFVFVPLPLLVVWLLVVSAVLVLRERRSRSPRPRPEAIGHGEAD